MSTRKNNFNPKIFLSTVGLGRKMTSFRKGQFVYVQGKPADTLFVIQEGVVKLTIRSKTDKEAILNILTAPDFVGNDSLSASTNRATSAVALTNCTLLRIDNGVMLDTLKRERSLANMFWENILKRNLRYQHDLFDQLCNDSESRLGRILLLLPWAELRRHRIKHQTLADMVGTTRSRISIFLAKFKKMGFIDYKTPNGLMRIHRPILARYVREHLPAEN